MDHDALTRESNAREIFETRSTVWVHTARLIEEREIQRRARGRPQDPKAPIAINICKMKIILNTGQAYAIGFFVNRKMNPRPPKSPLK
jgi:hypothetical protein